MVKEALKVPAVENALSGGRKIVGHFKHSPLASQELKKSQKELMKPEHCLIQDVKTRWNSTHDMAERLLEQRWVIAKVLEETGKDLMMESNHWKTLEAVNKVLLIIIDYLVDYLVDYHLIYSNFLVTYYYHICLSRYCLYSRRQQPFSVASGILLYLSSIHK